ncbi:unnamed protein product [Parnassius mnemosyne]|uniref:Integrase catalytic domain-containing protein n=1 Tax=Parnassius mnemosyne TaxID=213953 RepID=A0AAV1KRY1_9NEOP
MLKCILSNNLNVSNERMNELLLRCLFEYRTSIHSSTGETPSKLMFGREPRTRLDLILPPTNTDMQTSQDSSR